MRTHLCGAINEQLESTPVTLCGWVDRRRDLGGLIFLRLRDTSGLVQVVIEPDSGAVFAAASQLRNEFCVQVKGTVRMRPESQWNNEMATGKVELVAAEIELFNASDPIPLLLSEEDGEDVRLRYRYLDLRQSHMQHNLRLRAALYRSIRSSLDEQGFTELETPILTRATPEGARDYLVPSRVHKGQFYALPQSPQIFKQLFMMAGMDRYYQIARCFRDEDLRADRQPEFTQLDMELSFVDEAGVQSVAEAMMRKAFAEVLKVELEDPFPRMTYQDAMQHYGSDKPDLRFGLPLVDIDEHVKDVEFKVFAGPANDPGSRVAGLRVPGGAAFSRKQIDQYTDLVKKYGARGLAWLKVNDRGAGADGVASSIAKFLDDTALNGILESLQAESGDILFFGAGDWLTVSNFMGALRLAAARDHGLVTDSWKPLWVTDFPMFEWAEDSGRFTAMHHPFTAPSTDDPAVLKENPDSALSRGYDLVINGAEVGGGSIRIHNAAMQAAVFELLGISPEEAENKFGFLLKALKFGCPPHGGIAFGLDRIVALMAGVDSIREVIAFPKTTSAQCLLTEAPSAVDATQMADLGIMLAAKKPSAD
jgi:aspartyl-tRNA synthetase